jgi:hypothetical protein
MGTFESLPFFRGVSDRYPIDKPLVLTPRRDRRPRNSSGVFHRVADSWFKSRFGVYYRSQGLFVTSQRLSASTYGATADHVVRVVPLSSYRYCWSPIVSDLLFAATRLATAETTEIERYLHDACYRESGLDEAHVKGHEVMLYCERYVGIPVALLRNCADASSSILLLS